MCKNLLHPRALHEFVFPTLATMLTTCWFLPSDKLWEANDYESTNIAMETDEDEEEEEVEDDLSLLGDGSEVRAIQYVSGDVTQPINTGNEDAIVVHCVG